ncbi:hypothetical protein WBJ53_10860 [Spirosoma sp. SC4-14]|uniref:hypothetical protein n=1 Tax=Spirosoma sp. SC4-14 TaxID=3128900 RepID=UPI0030D0ED01
MAPEINNSYLRTRIVDDSNTLSIQIDGQKNGHTIHLNQVFIISDKNTLQKELFKYQAFRSQGLFLPLHEMPFLVGSGLGISLLLVSLTIIGFRRNRQRA